MAVVIQTTGLSKRYSIGNAVGGYSRLTEDITDAAARLLRRGPGERVEKTARELWALDDVSIEVEEGEVVGVIGRNGAGKTTLLKVMAQITEPTRGRAVVTGRVGSLLEVGTGFHPELTGRENVFLNGAILGMRRSEIRAKFDDIVGFAEVERFIDTPVKRYSSGMYVRLAFAVAAFLEPEILFIDEVLSVGDQAFQQRCIGRMGEIANSGRTILFVSHNLASVSALCSRGLLLDGGRVVRDGAVDEVIDHYVSTVQALSGERLDHRVDRKGDGRLRILRADVIGPNGGPARTGADAVLKLAYETNEVGREVTISAAIEGPLGEPVFLCSSRVSGDLLIADELSGDLLCDLPDLALLPGRYSLTFYVEVNGVVADWVRNAIFFDVFESDVFGSGQLPPPSYGRTFVAHSWSVGKLERVDARR
jgi:homopolymeric O-antigen transport system ATP-binding protein